MSEPETPPPIPDLDKCLAGFFIQSGVDVGAGVSDVVLQHGHIQVLLLDLLLALVVQRDQVMRQASVVHLVLRVQHQEDQIKPEREKHTNETT